MKTWIVPLFVVALLIGSLTVYAAPPSSAPQQVIVTNPTTNPVKVEVIPKQKTPAYVVGFTSAGMAGQEVYTVPSGKRFMIKDFSAASILEPGQVVIPILNCDRQYLLWLGSLSQSAIQSPSLVSFGRAVDFFCDGTVYIQSVGDIYIEVYISGYLEDI